MARGADAITETIVMTEKTTAKMVYTGTIASAVAGDYELMLKIGASYVATDVVRIGAADGTYRPDVALAVLQADIDDVQNRLPAALYLRERVLSNLEQMRVRSMQPTVAIEESLAQLRKDHPDPAKVAFIMMQFGYTTAHENVVRAIRSALDSRGIKALRADDKQYHDDLFPNVLTYIYGCGCGIAVFERIEAEDFNPNVSLEVGYMFALGKPVCLLKDRTLKTLHTDLVGKLYKEFDPQHSGKTIPEQIAKWLSDKGIASSPAGTGVPAASNP